MRQALAEFVMMYMDKLRAFTEKLRAGISLSKSEASIAAQLLTEGQPANASVDFLSALNQKGETVEEVTAFAKVFRSLALNPGLEAYADDAIDVVGTGGSGTRGYNISSATSLILASGGVNVLKHGNRAVTSKSGAADFLSQIGVKIQSDPDQLKKAVEEINFCFFFAPAFHPAFKEIVPVRKQLAALGQRSIFNILGPLINPAQPRQQLLGVFKDSWVKPLADCLTQLGMKRGLAVCGLLENDKMTDEITTATATRVAGMGELDSINEIWEPTQFGFAKAAWKEIEGGDAETNVNLFNAILSGNGPQGLRDTLVLNAGCGFYITQKSSSILEGCQLAKELIVSQKTKNWLLKAQQFYMNLK